MYISLDLYSSNKTSKIKNRNYLNIDKIYWIIHQEEKQDGLEFHFFIEAIHSFFSIQSLYTLLNIIVLSLFTPILSSLFKDNSFNHLLLKFKYPEYLLQCCEYLLIERYKSSEDSLM